MLNPKSLKIQVITKIRKLLGLDGKAHRNVRLLPLPQRTQHALLLNDLDDIEDYVVGDVNGVGFSVM